MKFRSRKYKLATEEPSYWPSFVDIMTTVTLVFFFLLIVSSSISKNFVDNIAKNRIELYTAIQNKLDENGVDKEIMRFNTETGKIEISTETFFESGKWDLMSDGIASAEILRNVFFALLSTEQIEKEIKYIEVVGHTDYIGGTINNRRLSTERAMSFLNSVMPMDSELENKYGHKFKASGMSEFETNPSKEERDRVDYEHDLATPQRKIEINIVFTNSDVEEAVRERIGRINNKK